jgi:hypothetical protein
VKGLYELGLSLLKDLSYGFPRAVIKGGMRANQILTGTGLHPGPRST